MEKATIGCRSVRDHERQIATQRYKRLFSAHCDHEGTWKLAKATAAKKSAVKKPAAKKPAANKTYIGMT